MAMSAEHRSKFAALHRQWWHLHMSEKFSSETINSKQTNKHSVLLHHMFSSLLGIFRCNHIYCEYVCSIVWYIFDNFPAVSVRGVSWISTYMFLASYFPSGSPDEQPIVVLTSGSVRTNTRSWEILEYICRMVLHELGLWIINRERKNMEG